MCVTGRHRIGVLVEGRGDPLVDACITAHETGRSLAHIGVMTRVTRCIMQVNGAGGGRIMRRGHAPLRLPVVSVGGYRSVVGNADNERKHEVNYETMNRTELDDARGELHGEYVGLQDEQDELLAKLTEANWDRYVEVNDRIEDVKCALSEADGVYLMNFVY